MEDREKVLQDVSDYIYRNLTQECLSHVEDVYVIGSYASGDQDRESDIDIFLVIDSFDFPAAGDVNMICMSNVPEAVRQGLGKKPRDRWTRTREWNGRSPEEATEMIPEYIVKSMRNIIAEPFSTSESQRWVDVYFGKRSHLHTNKPKEKIDL